jgi:hypothetical protein
LHSDLSASNAALDDKKYGGEENERDEYAGEGLFESRKEGSSLANNRETLSRGTELDGAPRGRGRAAGL